MKRITALLLTGFMLCLATCSDTPTSTSDSEPPTPGSTVGFVGQEVRTIRMPSVYEGALASRVREIEEEINRLLRDEANVKLRLEFVPIAAVPVAEDAVSSAYNFSQVLVHDIDKHRFDIFPGYFMRVEDYPRLVDEGVVMDIGEHLRLFPNLTEMSAEEAWKEATIGEGIWWFPLASSPNGGTGWGYHDLEVEQTLLDAIGADFPRTLDEMTAILRELKDRGLPHKLLCSTIRPPLALHRTYEEWPFYVSLESLFIYYADGSMEPYIESDIFLKDAAILRELDAEGLVVWYDYGIDEPITNSQDIGAAMGSTNGALYGSYNLNSQLLAPEKPAARIGTYATGAIFVSPTCQDPQAALEMIEAIYSYDKIALTLIYGIEGKDWHIQEDGALERINRAFSSVGSAFYRYQNKLPYMTQDELARLETIQGQSYPFSGFWHDPYDSYMSFGEDAPPLDESLMEAIGDIYDLRRGMIPMTERDTVIQRLKENGFSALWEETRARYERHKER